MHTNKHGLLLKHLLMVVVHLLILPLLLQQILTMHARSALPVQLIGKRHCTLARRSVLLRVFLLDVLQKVLLRELLLILRRHSNKL